MTTEFQHNFNVFLVYGTQIGQFVSAWLFAGWLFMMLRFFDTLKTFFEVASVQRYKEMKEQKVGS